LVGRTVAWLAWRRKKLAEKMKFPVGIGSGHFSFFLSADNVYFSLVAGSTLTLSADRGRVRPGWTSWQCGVCREYIFPNQKIVRTNLRASCQSSGRKMVGWKKFNSRLERSILFLSFLPHEAGRLVLALGMVHLRFLGQ